MPVTLIITLSVVVFLVIIIYFELLRSKYVLAVRRTDLVLDCLPEDFDQTRIVLISDLHQMSFGQNNEMLARKILLEEPDYIFFAGDMGDAKAKEIDAFYDLIEALGRERPIIVIPGNHDLALGGGRMHVNIVRELTAAGAVVLNNKSAELVKGSGKLYLYGFCQPLEKPDAKERHYRLSKVSGQMLTKILGKCPTDAPAVMLAHDPTYFSYYSEWGAKVIFAGHNHGGIFRLPFLGGLFGSDGKLNPKYTRGVYRRKGSTMIVTSGLGSSLMPRFMNQPEIRSVLLLRYPLPEEQKTSAKEEFILTKESFMAQLKRGFGIPDAIKAFFARIGNFFKNVASDLRSLGKLIRERSDQISDFFSEMFGKQKSRFAEEGDRRKKNSTYTAEKYRARMGHDTEKKREAIHKQLFGKADSGSASSEKDDII